MQISLESIVFIATTFTVLVVAYFHGVRLKKSVTEQMDNFVCNSTARLIQPIVDAQTKLAKTQAVIIKDRIVQAHDHYMRLGHIGIYALNAIEDMYQDYVDSGHNHFVVELMEDLRGLPRRTLDEEMRIEGGI